MKTKLVTTSGALVLFAVCAYTVAPVQGGILPATAQEKPKEQPKISEDEAKALDKMNKAASTTEKVKLGNEFIKKFKKTTVRGRVVDFLVGQILSEKDPNQKMQSAQQFIAAFDQPGEADQVKPALIEGLITTGKIDEGYTEGAKYLEKNPDDVFTHAILGWNGAMLVQKNGPTWKWKDAASAHATKAVELLEQDKKPEKIDAKFWGEYRNAWLPKLYQAQGFMAFFGNDKPKAKEYLEKAVGFDPYDYNTLAMLADIAGTEYQTLAQKYQASKQSALLDQALAKMDETIDWLARSVAAAEGQASLKEQAAQMLENLKQYYGFRHENKMDGLQPLINKYKKPAQ